jgi:hypothetical protein
VDVPAADSTISASLAGGPLVRRWQSWAALSLALSAALLVILPFARAVRVAEYDEAVLLDVAGNIQRMGLPLRSMGAHGVAMLDHTPLYPFLLSLYAPAPGESLLLARGVTVIAALLCVALTYQIGVILGGRSAGFLAAAFVSLNPFLAVYAYFARMEAFMVAFALVAIYVLVRRLPVAARDAFIAGCALAVAVLFKEFALILVFPAGIYAWGAARGGWRSRLRTALAVTAPPVLALIAWGIWAMSIWPDQFVAAMRRWIGSAAGGSIADPRMGTGALSFSGQLANDLFGPGLTLGLLVALVWLAVRRGRVGARAGLLYGYLLAALFLAYLVRLREPRHLIALVPVAAILAAIALLQAGAAAQRHGPAMRAAAVVAVAGLLLLSGPWRVSGLTSGAPSLALAPTYRERLRHDAFYGLLARAGQEAARRSAPDEMLVVAHQGPVIAYYADRRYLMLYTLKEPAIQKVLDGARVLIWDTPTWLALPPDRVPAVEARVAADFELTAQVREGPRVVTIHERKP